ncbi:LamG domain-containing protein, partial [Lacinutrix chionoecetis]
MKIKLLLVLTIALSCLLSYAQNTDGDSYANYLDLDDDNDGIQDRYESSDYVLSKFRWTLNFPAGNLTMDEVYNTKITDWALSSTSILTFNSSIFSVQNNEIEISSTPSNTFAEALSNGDYIEMSFVTSTELSDITLRNVSSGWYIPSSGDSFYTATQFSETSTGTWTTLSSDVFHTDDGTSYANFDNMTVPNIKLKSNTSYTVRFYIYGQVNDTSSTFSNIDDFTFFIDASRVQDTDNDGTPDHLDLDSDNDGCPDALEGDAPNSQIGYSNLDTNSQISGGVDSRGRPVIAYGGQAIGTSIDASLQATECDPCDPDNPEYIDTDGDGYADACDLDDDNDGILDEDECSTTFKLKNGTPVLSSTDVNDLQVGDIILFPDAIKQCTQSFDALITIEEKMPGLIIELRSTFLSLNNVIANNDDYVRYAITAIETGSATTTNPNGITATVNNFTLKISDLDSDLGQDYTEVAGFNNASSPTNVYLDTNTRLEQNGFLGGDPAGYTLYRLNPASDGDVNDWTDEINTNKNNGIYNPQIDLKSTIFIEYNTFSTVSILFGVTGTHNNPKNRGITHSGYKYCDTDNDGIENSKDLDSDNDGIPDNIEAQSTIGYILPSGVVNSKGVDTNYSSGLILEDTDGDTICDCLDQNSDNDDFPDIEENGMADTFTLVDADNDGLLDIFETTNNNDALWDVNEDIEDPTDLSILPDTDSDIIHGGDLDYRDNIDVYHPSASIDFDGVDDYLSAGEVLDLSTSDFTMSAWIKLDTNIGNFAIMGRMATNQFPNSQTRGVSLEAQFGTTTSPSKLYFIAKNGFSSKVVSTSDRIIRKNQWYHVATTYDGNNVRLFINGEAVSTNNNAVPRAILPDLTGLDFTIGSTFTADQTSTRNHFDGAIDEIRVFNSVLTDDQIQRMVYQEIYNNSGNVHGAIIPKDVVDIASGTPVLWSSLEAYYPMTNIVSNRTTDYSSNNNHATLHNITTIQAQTAPLPYETVNNGAWTEESTWLHGNVWDITDVTSNKPWSIVHIKDNITSSNSHNQIGMFIDNNKSFTVSGENQINNSWYLELNGTLDLQDDSQLVQGIHSDLLTSANGRVLRRQEGTSNVYRYNYWSS